MSSQDRRLPAGCSCPRAILSHLGAWRDAAAAWFASCASCASLACFAGLASSACLALCAPAPAAAATDGLTLQPGRYDRSLADDVRYVELPGSIDLAAALALPESSFAPLGKPYIDFGTTSKTVWLSLDLHNAGAEAGRWVLSFNVRFMTALVAYQAGSGGGRLLLRQAETSPFGARPIRYRMLAAPFSLAAGERARLLIGYRSKGTTKLPLSIETEASFAQRSARDDAFDFASYTPVLFMIGLSLLQWLLFGQRFLGSYAVYLTATLAYIVHMDGYTFEYLWPSLPRWNSFAAIVCGLLMSVAALWFARGFTEIRRVAPALDKLMLALMALAGITIASGFLLPEAMLKSTSFAIASTSAACCLAAGVTAHLRGQSSMRFFVVGWVGVFLGVFLTSVGNDVSGLMSVSTARVLPKLTIIFDSVMFYMALGDRARTWRRERDAASRRELEALRKQQETADALHATEREKLKALLQAQTASRQLASASHDIRQPLTSLRLALHRLTDSRALSASVVDHFRQSLDYLDRLANTYTREAAPREDELASAEAFDASLPVRSASPARRLGASFSATMLIRNVELMFREEAEGKGLEFRCRAAAAEVEGDAMAAMRIVSNLVANAIRYTRRGKVLVAARRRGAGLVIIVADTGPGICEEELQKIFREGERGAASAETPGSGLGLAIAESLAEDCGYALEVESARGKGTAFRLVLPLAAASVAAEGVFLPAGSLASAP